MQTSSPAGSPTGRLSNPTDHLLANALAQAASLRPGARARRAMPPQPCVDLSTADYSALELRVLAHQNAQGHSLQKQPYR